MKNMRIVFVSLSRRNHQISWWCYCKMMIFYNLFLGLKSKSAFGLTVGSLQDAEGAFLTYSRSSSWTLDLPFWCSWQSNYFVRFGGNTNFYQLIFVFNLPISSYEFTADRYFTDINYLTVLPLFFSHCGS